MKDEDKNVGQLISELRGQREQIVALKRTATQLNHTQQGLRDQLKIQELISELCIGFVNSSVADVDGRIEYSLKRLGELLGHERTSLRRYVQKESQLLATHWWAADGIQFPPKALLYEKVPYLIRTLMSGKVFVFSTLKDLPSEAQVDRQWFENLGQKSALAIPLRAGGSVIGGMTFGCFGAQKHWPHSLIRRLELLGEILAHAISRSEAENEFDNRSLEEPAHRAGMLDRSFHVPLEMRLSKSFRQLVGKTLAIRQVLHLAKQVAATDATVLIMGETGTGKELLARAVHGMSLRRKQPMVTVNCSALPSTLIESELFGHVKGAFTGAYAKEMGRFELAHGATLFLDEIGDLAIEAQPRLLRAIQEGEFERIGSPRTLKVDVRIIAATNKDLAEAARAGTFRKDLYYRLNVFPLVLPPLRRRTEDIPELVWTFVREFEEKMGKRVDQIPASSMKALQDYHWPGNIRELRNTVERAMLVHKGPTLDISVPEESRSLSQDCGALALEEMEKKHILRVLATTGGRVKGNGGAAEILQINPSTLFSRMRKLGIKPLN